MVATKGEQIKEKIIELLRKHPEGLTIQDLAKELKVHRQTVTKYVLELKGAGIVIRKRVGSATLHYLKEKYVQKVTEEEVIEKLKEKLS
jgi:predicted transcriptional regulator